jgi:hypothetical protein
MTASKTPNLALMNPVGTDPFTTTDFSDTFTKLDNVPGVQVVANYASLPTGWSAVNHGRFVWQADLNIMWIWNQPSSSVAGVWQRFGNYGLLASAINATQVNATQVNWTAAPVAVQVTAMIPGGRACLVMTRWQYVANDHANQVTLNFIENSSSVMEQRFTGSSYGVVAGNPPTAGAYWYIRGASSTQQSVNFQLRVRAQDPAIVGSGQGGGTSAIWSPFIAIFEV